MSKAAIVNVGVRTAIGLNARQTGFLLRAGFPAIAGSSLADSQGEPITMSFLPTLSGERVGPERLMALCEAPLREAVEPISDTDADVFIALDERCEEIPLATRLLTAMVTSILPGARVQVEAGGEAAPSACIEEALGSLEHRRSTAVVIGGVHSDYDPRVIAALEKDGRLFSADNLDARIPGECAAFFVLMGASEAARTKLPVYGRVLGVGRGRERARPDNSDPAYEAFGLSAAVRCAAAPLSAAGRTAGWMLTDLTSEMRRVQEWQSVFVRSQDVLGRPYWIDSPAARIGYLGAAAIPLFAAMAVTAWRYGYAPSSTVLAVAGNDGGDRAALVLEKV